jgi:uncharacterized Zn finger protein
MSNDDDERVANRHQMYEHPRPLTPAHRVSARTQRGSFTKKWWATRWLRALTDWANSARLIRGRAYARQGQVVDIAVQVGAIVAQVQGTRARPYRVRIEIKTFADAEWERVVDLMAAQAIYAAQLLNGEMPLEIEDVFSAAGVSLFPSSTDDLASSCSCPDWSEFCKHRAAVCYLMGEQIDGDPFLLFVLRGRTKEQVLAALRAKRADKLPGDEAEADQAKGLREAPLPEAPDAFWRIGPELDRVEIHVRSPEVEMEILKVLGDMTFVDDPEWMARLAAVYRQVSKRALALAFDVSDVEM